MIRRIGRWAALAVGLGIGCLPVAALSDDMIQQSDVRLFITEVSKEHGFPAAVLNRLFTGTEPDEKVLALMSRPAEKKEWSAYKPLFITDRMIINGRRFLRHHITALVRAEEIYGVPPAIITAIIGVETRYGENMGSHGVFRSLATLAFYYPKRSDFFRRELIQFLLLARELDKQPDQLYGSYAGALGIPQFLSSSYRHYAVDFDGDSRIDIWRSVIDAIGSVGNYLHRHGWHKDSGIARRLYPSEDQWRQLTANGDRVSVAQLESAGVLHNRDDIAGDEQRLFQLSGADGVEYWTVSANFDVITKYNHSDLYAMAVFQLAESISATRRSTDDL